MANSICRTARYPALGQHAFYRALGTGEQGLWVIPGAEVVVVHRADTDHGRIVDGENHSALLESILAARRSENPQPVPDLRPLQPAILSSQLPPAGVPEYRALPDNILDDYLGGYKPGPGASALGEYKLTPGAPVRVFVFAGKPFVHLPGAGDVQLLPAVRPDTFTVRVVQGIGIAFKRGSDDQVNAVTLTLGDTTIEASRVQRS